MLTEEQFVELTFGGGTISGVVEGDLEVADGDVPPVDLVGMDVPGLGNARVHERMAQLRPTFGDDLLCVAGDLTEEAALVTMSSQFL